MGITQGMREEWRPKIEGARKEREEGSERV